MEKINKNYRRSRIIWMIVLSICGIVINLGGAALAEWLELPLFLDTVGTVLAAGLGGFVPGVTVGLLSNVIKALISDPASIYYGFINVMIAVITAFSVQKG